MNDIFAMNRPALQDFLFSQGMKKFRADQILHYIYKEHVYDWDDMLLLPKSDRTLLKKELPLYVPAVVAKQISGDGNTVKLLLELIDGQTVETVLMKHDYGNSVCLSSQVGCAVNCAFCASAKNGFIRNLTVGEMVSQLLAFRKYVTADLHSIVLMGTGEPLLNYDNVLAFMRLIHEKETLYLGYRNMTLSTSGIVPAMDRFSSEGLPVNLAVSLHAPNDRIRRRIMPVAGTYALKDILAAADRCFKATGRRVTFEYILIRDVTCTPDCATQLVRLLAGKNILVKAIPVNDNYDVGLHRPEKKQIDDFCRYVKNHGVHITLRREMGSGIQAVRAQLRSKRRKERV
ncbi:23S rRNA (adenine(2503)-C(2))-methyltransferase RlmN [Anaeroglobus geminatus]|uniref:23S rRNA m2A2503 methyltransferase n=1 Tax=Anaeroglobus geminatus F0357 TaxID=861450 RepID=G9YGJ8_9FIRM|nr:23S rRNA (adenine(2503)-C(2))-methyltransferase RlmN [Anaeroglobus geminatus]EHM42220.1 23S rRNA m2A2503 methyltransferase [Anaeroglobus geminatus F0357]